ncbi:MAG: alpha/beta hydrolase [Actinobacteria bacterium]|nr:alpha/beta hydrolase [Actinomycetota bacterium]
MTHPPTPLTARRRAAGGPAHRDCITLPTHRGRARRTGAATYGRVVCARTSLVTTDDGVALAVHEVGPPTAPVTVVFCHGLCLDMRSWRYQRAGLSRMWGAEVRMVFYDQRGHGASADGHPRDCTIERLGRDLSTVLDVVADGRRVVLVGHSMGGMAILAYLGAHPHVVGTRVIGVGLIASAADAVARAGLGRALRVPVIEALRLATSGPDPLVQGGWRLARLLAEPLVGGGVTPTRLRARAVVSFLSAIRLYDESRTLALLATVPALVLCGTDDPLTPATHSMRLADSLCDAELVMVDGARHEVTTTHPHIVCCAIARLLTRAVDRCREPA